jgi:hypothetical protein
VGVVTPLDVVGARALCWSDTGLNCELLRALERAIAGRREAGERSGLSQRIIVQCVAEG